MKTPTYMIIETDPDGDSYEIHKELKEAKGSFEEKRTSGSLWSEGTLYLIEVKAKSFGFCSQGIMYGAEIIEEHEFAK